MRKKFNLSLSQHSKNTIKKTLGANSELFEGLLCSELNTLNVLYALREEAPSFKTIDKELSDISKSVKALRLSLLNMQRSTESLIHQGHVIRGNSYTDFKLSSDFPDTLENIYLSIETILNDARPGSGLDSKWREKELVIILIKCWHKSRQEIPPRSEGGLFDELSAVILENFEMEFSWKSIRPIIAAYEKDKETKK